MSQQQACVYAALILSDSGKTDAASILAVTKAAKIDVSAGMASAFAAVLKGCDLSQILSNVAFSGAGAPPAAASAGGAVAASAEEDKSSKKEKEPEPEEEDDDLGFGGLF